MTTTIEAGFNVVAQQSSTNESISNGAGDGIFYISYYPHAVVVAVIYCTTSIFGILGNGLVIGGVFFSPQLRTPTNILIVNLAIADLLTCLALPFQSLAVLSPPNQVPLPTYACTIIGGIIYVAFTCSAITLTLISIVRCYVIVKTFSGTGLNTVGKQLKFALFSWILASFYIFFPAYGFELTEFAYYLPYKQCFTRETPYSSLYHRFLAFMIAIHVCIIMGCYFKIWMHVMRHRRKYGSYVGSVNGRQDGDLEAIKRLSTRELRVTINLFTVVIAFIICTIPTAVSFAMSGAVVLGCYTTAILYFNNCINPALYAFKHPIFKRMFLGLLRRTFSCGRKDDGENCRTKTNGIIATNVSSKYSDKIDKGFDHRDIEERNDRKDGCLQQPSEYVDLTHVIGIK